MRESVAIPVAEHEPCCPLRGEEFREFCANESFGLNLQSEREDNGQYTRDSNQWKEVMSELRQPVYLDSQGGDDDADNRSGHL